MSTLIPNAGPSTAQPVVAPAKLKARDLLRDRVLTITNCDSAEAMAMHLDSSYEGLVITGAERLAKMRRLRRVFPDLLLIAEPDSHAHLEATPDTLWLIEADDDSSLLPPPDLDDHLASQRGAGASLVLPPAGFIHVGDTETLLAVIRAANELTGDDIAVPLYLASAWLRPEYKEFLLAALPMSEHPILLSFGSSTNPLDSARKLGLYQQIVGTTGAFSWRTDLAGIEALAHGGLGAAIGAGPGLRRFTPPKDSGKARRPDDATPYTLIPGHMHWMKTGAMREELYVSIAAPICGCRECDGRSIDRFTDALNDKDSAARHNHAVIDDYAQAVIGSPPAERRRVWRSMVQDAYVAHEATSAIVGRPWKAPNDIATWADS